MEDENENDQQRQMMMRRSGGFSSVGKRLLEGDLIAVRVLNRVTGKVGLWTLEQFEEKLKRMRVEANPHAQAVNRVLVIWVDILLLWAVHSTGY